MKTIPDQSFWKLWNISFGFFGVQIAYALQSANISRIAALGRYYCPAYYWRRQRQDVEPFWTAYSLFVLGCDIGVDRHVPVA